MNIKVDLKDLVYALNIVKDTVGSDSRGHQGIRIYASKKNNRVKLSTHDGNHATEIWLDASVTTAGKCVVKADRFVKYVFKAGGSNATLSVNDSGALKVGTSTGKTTFFAYDPDSFPEMPTVDEDNSFEMAGKMYRSLITGVGFCTQAEKGDASPMQGIHFVSNGKRIELSATNGNMIAFYKKKLQAGKMDVTLSKKSLVNSARMVKDDDRVIIKSGRNATFAVKFRDVTYYIPVYDAGFPDLKKALPTEDFDGEFIAEKKSILETLDRSIIALASKGGTKGIIHFEKGRVTLTGNTEEVDLSETVPCTLVGEPTDVKVDLSRMMEVIKNIDSDVIHIGLRDEKPITVRPEGKTDHTCLLAIG